MNEADVIQQDQPLEAGAADLEKSPSTDDSVGDDDAPGPTAADKRKEKKMAKKGRKKRGKRAKRSQHPAAVADSNVIQFPAVKAAEEEAQVAVGGDISSDSMPKVEAKTEREDETGSHRRDGESAKKDDTTEAKTAKAADAKADEKADDIKSESAKSKPAADKSKSKGPKKKRTTSSAVIRALTQTGEHAQVTEEFFTAETYEAAHEEGHETWEDLRMSDVPLAADEKRFRSLAIVGGGILTAVIAGMLIYFYYLTPQPEELGSGRVTLPDLSSIGAPQAEGNPEPVAANNTPPATDPAAPAVDPTAVDPEAVDPEAIDPEAVDPEAVDPEAVDPEATDPEAVDPEAIDPEAVDPGAAVPEVAPEAPVAPEALQGDYASLLGEATELERRHRRRQAMEAYRRAIDANPNGGEALANLAFMLLNRSQNREALELAERATTLAPTNSKAWITLGAARQATGDTAGGREAYQHCVDQGEGRYVRDCRAMLR